LVNYNSDDIRARINSILEREKKSIVKTWIPWIGLLILLDDYYGPFIKSVPLNPYDISTRIERINRNEEWRKKFSPNRILFLSSMKLEDIKQFYEWFSFHTRNIDPLSKWFILQQILKVSRRYQPENKALLAQDYYAYLFMLASFIYDLSGEKILDPDDILDGEGGSWKVRIFGEPFDYTTKKTQNQILKYFLIDRPYELVFLVEGETEEKVIELILKARGVDLEKDGFFVYNIKGKNNLEHLKPLFRVSQLIDISIFAMIDDDKDVDESLLKMKQGAEELGYTKEIMVRKWDRDFESENFGIDKVIEKINQILSENGYTKVNKEQVEKRMKSTGDALVKAAENVISMLNHDKFIGSMKARDVISKPAWPIYSWKKG
jgi:hypothetical protein